MKKEFVIAASTSRAIALAGLIALNTALPAEATEDCQACMTLGGQLGCLHGQPSGHELCAPDGDHCDVFYPCS
jgi:hypothetical protein